MSKNIDLVRQLFQEVANRKDASLYEVLCAKDMVAHGPSSGQEVKGLGAAKKVDENLFETYPETKFKIETIFGQGALVFVRWSCTGRYKQGHKGLIPKKNGFCIEGMSLYRIAKGKIAEIWQSWDRLGILEQIGEVHVRTVEPGYYSELLKGLGMEKYVEKASLLSTRERECLELLLQGKTAKETAYELRLSYRTVESYFVNLKKKLKCTNKGELFSTAQILRKLELL
jgi:DNA-binding CsgD family transcriptional regulator/predicted ester cyclase